MGLTKIIIKGYNDKKLSEQDGPHQQFIIPINPESYSRNMKVEYEKKKGQGNQKTNPKYSSTDSEKIKLEFILDGTGTVEGYHHSLKDKPVAIQIEDLLKTIYRVKGKTHKPQILKISWGKEFVYDCILETLDINYTLFNEDAEPLRAKISAAFCGYVEPTKRVIEEDKRSADLTHIRQVLAEDRLTLMTHNIYGKSAYYTQIARVNNLTSFRNLEVGKELVFPPLQKKTT